MERNDCFINGFVNTVHCLKNKCNKYADTENVENRVDRNGADWIVVCAL